MGALLWLLSSEPGYYHRLGGGKPFGFGSVSLSINWAKTDLKTGTHWQEYYKSLFPVPKPDQNLAEESDQNLAEECVKLYKTTVEQAYGDNNQKFENISFIAAFCRAAQGFTDDLPIHYPKTNRDDDKGFTWFVKNESGQKLALRLLSEDNGLPFNP
ncbi:hypothetical protein [Gloeocapsa sp. PCC 73106]|uniref:hypothetical protein n=1 Tax=Gloeocapsa sp. PCC 73106 TaxID=102232 RepID=UPI0002ACAAF0|nr:hypothetical protein [Gloeocapsa sp. PCC 73106]ELR99328.1 hypothetical protein GLO73106DRAFT_00031780 [Gloeocapsa sp. PCC 73106]